MILATIERHKQNSETFNKAFNSSFSREEDHIPDSPVSLATSWRDQPVGGVLFTDSWQASGSSHEFITLTFGCPRTALHLWLWPYRTHKSHIKKLFSWLTLADVASGRLSQQDSLSWPNREGWSLSVYKTLMDLLWPTLGWLSAAESASESTDWHLATGLCNCSQKLTVFLASLQGPWGSPSVDSDGERLHERVSFNFDNKSCHQRAQERLYGHLFKFSNFVIQFNFTSYLKINSHVDNFVHTKLKFQP